MVVGGLACDHTEMVDGQAADIIRRRIVTTLEMRVRDDGVGAQQTSQIEGFGRRGEFKDDIRVLSPQRGEHGDLMSRIGKVGVNLVAQQTHTAFDTDIANAPQFFRRPDTAHRVVRIAQNHGRAARIGGLGFEIIKINAIVAVLVQYQLVVENGQTIVLGGKGERVIDRPLDNDLISRSGDGSQGRVDGRHHAVGQAHP